MRLRGIVCGGREAIPRLRTDSAGDTAANGGNESNDERHGNDIVRINPRWAEGLEGTKRN